MAKSSASSTTTPSTVTRDLPPGRASRIRALPGRADTAVAPGRSTSTPGSCSAASPASSGCASSWRASGHTLVVTSDKDGPDSVFERELPDADVVISQPFWPAYLTAERIAKAPKLKLAITAGIGSDHVDLQAAIDARRHRGRGDLLQQHQRGRARRDDDPVAGAELHPVIPVGGEGGWNIADCVERSYDLEGMTVGTVGAGRIGLAVLRRLKPFDVKLHYTDRHRLPDGDRAGARAGLPPDRRVAGEGLRRGHDQRPAPPRDRGLVQRRADLGR